MHFTLRPRTRPILWPVNATELLNQLTSRGLGTETAPRAGATRAVTLHTGIEVGMITTADEKRLRSQWRKRVGSHNVRYLLLTEDPDRPHSVLALGPRTCDAPVRSLNTKSLFGKLQTVSARGLDEMGAIRRLEEEISLLDQKSIAGVEVRGLLTVHTLKTRLPDDSRRWSEMADLVQPIGKREDWRTILSQLGYELEHQKLRGYLARCDGRPAVIIHPKKDPTRFSRLDQEGKPPEGVLMRDCAVAGARYGMLVCKGRFRLFDTDSPNATGEWLDIDASSVEDEHLPLLALLSPPFLADGKLEQLRAEARSFGAELHKRLDKTIRNKALPALATGIQRWANQNGVDVADDETRRECEHAALTLLFRLLFILYAESSRFLPIDNYSYRGVALSSLVEEAAEKSEYMLSTSTALWDRFATLVRAMRNGNQAWGVPAYNGSLFAETGFEGAELLEQMELTDSEFAEVLVAVGRDTETGGGVDFSTLEIGHLGHIYETLLSIRLSIADRPLRYDAKREKYIPVDSDIEVATGELLWLTHEGGRKAGGVYYTRVELVQHLVDNAVLPAFKRHLDKIRSLANTDPKAAADQLFDFSVLDPACGSGHFLVQVVKTLADHTVQFLAETPLPSVTDKINNLRKAETRGVYVDDVGLLRRLIIKRCVFGVDLSPMGAEIAALSLWLVSFVPGLSLSYLKRNIVVGNSLLGVVDPKSVGSKGSFWYDELQTARGNATKSLLRLAGIDDRTPDEVRSSELADEEAEEHIKPLKRLFDMWTIGGLGLNNAKDFRTAVDHQAAQIITGDADRFLSEQIETASRLAEERRLLHWPVSFPHIFWGDNPGFDVVVGNPPWEEVRVDRLEFYARIQPGLAGLRKLERESAIQRLVIENPELPKQLEKLKQDSENERYALTTGEYQSIKGKPDLYHYFCQRYRTLVHNEGKIGVVLPRVAFINDTLKDFRNWLFEHTTIERIDFLLNNKQWIFDTHPQYTIALLVASKNQSTDNVIKVLGIANSLKAWVKQSKTPAVIVSPDSFGSNWITPLLRSQEESDILNKVRSGTFLTYPNQVWGGGGTICRNLSRLFFHKGSSNSYLS